MATKKNRKMAIKKALKTGVGTIIGGFVGLGIANLTGFFALVGLPMMLLWGMLGGIIINGGEIE